VQETYGNVKNLSPAYVQSTLSTIEGLQAVSTITGQLETVSQPLIVCLDERLEGVINNLEDLKSKAGELKEDLSSGKLKEDITSNIKNGIETRAESIKTGIETRAETIKSEIGKQAEPYYTKALEIKSDLGKQAEPYYTKALEIKTDLETRADALKTDIETKAGAIKTELDTKAVQWKSVRGDLSKKTIQRLEEGFSSVKQFSSEQSKAYLHIDLIEYATEVIDNAQTTVKPTFEALNEKVASGILTVSKSISSFQEMASQKTQEGMEQAEAWRAELRRRLSKAIAASRELSHHSAEYVVVRYRKIQGLDREQLRAAFKDSVQYILESPQLFAKLTQRLEQVGNDLTSISALEHINRLLSSLQEVIIPSSVVEKTVQTDEAVSTEETKECKDENVSIGETKECKNEDDTKSE